MIHILVKSNKLSLEFSFVIKDFITTLICSVLLKIFYVNRRKWH